MQDIATLGLSVDDKDFVDAASTLDNFAAAAGKAEDAANSVSDAAAKAGTGVKSYGEEVREAYGLTEKLTQGELQVIQALEDQINFISLTKSEQAAFNAVRLSGTKVDSEAAVVIESLARAYERLAATQRAAADQRAKTSQQEFHELLGGPQSGKSARASAQIIDLELARTERIAKQRAQQIGATFAEELNERLVNQGIRKTAKEAADVFSAEFARVEAIAQARTQQAGQNFANDLNDRLGIGRTAKSAQESAEAFGILGNEAVGLRAKLNAMVQAAQFANGPIGSLARGVTQVGLGVSRMGFFIIGGIASLTALAAAAVRAVAAYASLEQHQNRINNALAFTKNSSGQGSPSSIEAIVARLSRTGNSSTGDLRTASAELLRFREVSGAVFAQTITLAQRLEQTGFMPLVDATKLLGSAMKNPADGFESLRNAGFSLSPILERNVRNLYDAGRTADAQKVLFRALEEQVGNVQGNRGLSGSFTALGNSTNRFFEIIGGKIATVTGLETAIRSLAGGIDALNTAASNANNDAFFKILDRIAKALPTLPMFNAALQITKIGVNAGLTATRPFETTQGYDEGGFLHISAELAAQNAARERQQQRIDAVKDSLTEELRVQRMSALQQRIDAELRKAGTDAISEQGKEIARLVASIEAVNLVRGGRDAIRRQAEDARVETAAIGMTYQAAEQYRAVQDKIIEAKIRGITLSPAAIALLEKEAAAMSRLAHEARAAKIADDLRFERSQLGLNPAEAQIAATLRQNRIDANSTAGQMLAQEMRLNEALKQTRDLTADVAKGFASDMMRGVSAAEAFGNALNRIANKLMDMAIDNLVAKAFGGAGSSFGGGIGGLIAGLFTGGGTGVSVAKMHNGGLGMYASPSNVINLEAFRNAPRFHSGKKPWGPGEMPAIIQEEEEVITTADPRHSWNGGNAAASGIVVQNFFEIDASNAQPGVGAELKAALTDFANSRTFKVRVAEAVNDGKSRGLIKGAA